MRRPSERINFTCTALVGTNKVGTLKKDENGYYPVVLGALDVFNHSGDFWPAATSKEIFKESSSFMRRISRAALRSEYGHPKREPGQSISEYSDRLMRIYELNVCCHISKVWLETSRVKDQSGKVIIAIMGLVRPSGPLGPTLEAQFQNPHENVCFSIRAVTNDYMVRGRNEKNIREIVTWDYVNEPGIAAANKYSAPSLESLEESSVPLELLAQHVKNQQTLGLGISMEDSEDMNLANLVKKLTLEQPKVASTDRPGSTHW